MNNDRSVFRSRKPRALARGASFFVILDLCVGFACYGDQDRDRQQQLSQQSIQQYQPPQAQQAQRPILPPTVPSNSGVVSPTPSPHISTPYVTQIQMNAPSVSPQQQSYTIPVQSLPSMPAQAPMPVADVSTALQMVPVVQNAVGKVLNKGESKDGTGWLEVKDQLFDETLKIVINQKTTPVIKKSAQLNYNDIKIGDMVNVIFNQEDSVNKASFISILTEEDMKALEEPESGPGASEDSEDKDNPPSE